MIRYLVGDVFDRMAELEDGSVDLILTSPPFLALRSYLPADHPDKEKEIGSEATPAEFIDTLLRLSAEWRRLLAPHGTLAVELGDTYSGSGGAGGDYAENGWRAGQPKWRGYDGRGPRDTSSIDRANTGLLSLNGGPGWPLAKSLTLVPESYRFALAYGINPHTGQPSPAGQWRIRNVVRWVRPNPPVGALGDKFRPATSELVVAAVSKDRWFDLDAVREPHKDPSDRRDLRPFKKTEAGGLTSSHPFTRPQNPAGAPPLDWWKISPKGYAGAHYAVWPAELCVKPIKAMCPEWVCRECGEPRRRIVEREPFYVATGERTPGGGRGDGISGMPAVGHGNAVASRVVDEYWTDCGHDNYRRGLVLDPFAGTGTTLAVAHGHGRDAIGIDLDSGNVDLALERVGPLFMEVE